MEIDKVKGFIKEYNILCKKYNMYIKREPIEEIYVVQQCCNDDNLKDYIKVMLKDAKNK